MARPLLLGIEIGGTKLQVGLGHGDDPPLLIRRSEIDPASGAAGILARIIEETDRGCWAINTSRSAIEAVGIGFGGPLDADRGIVTTSHHVPGWDQFHLADWCRKELGIEAVSIQNDADTAGLAEARFGAGKRLSPLLYVTVGSGIGGGLIRDGRIDRGSGLGAAEIGHLWIVPPLDDGTGGETVEQAASGWSIARNAREAIASGQPDGETLRDLIDDDPTQINAEVVAMAAGLGDPLSLAILDHATRSLAAGLAHAVTLIGPKRIILGGGVSQIGDDLWLDPIRRRLDALVFPPFRGSYTVEPAALGDAVVVRGALYLALRSVLATHG